VHRYDDAVVGDATFDSSFWMHAYRSGLLSHVLQRFRLHVAPDVETELQPANPSAQEFHRLRRAGVIDLVQPTASPMQEFGRGERAAINVASEHPDWTLLLDDYRPYRTVAGQDIAVLCTPLFAVLLFREGTLDEPAMLRVLSELAAIETVSPHLLAAALAHLGRLFRESRSEGDGSKEGGD
jgi:hypothetical protein